eukprot:1145616-Pelagomonas_calceolata.AAC.3
MKKKATTLITKACYLMQIRALAMPSGACLASQQNEIHIFQYSTGTLYNKKRAVRFNRSTPCMSYSIMSSSGWHPPHSLRLTIPCHS